VTENPSAAHSFRTCALAWAKAGYKVFPTQPGTKRPLPGSRGVYDATRDVAKIYAWADADDNYGVAVAPASAGCIVIDVDVKNGVDGFASLAELETDLGIEIPADAPRYPTPSGGEHIWFRGHGPSTAGRLGPGLDTRGEGGYVVAYGPPIHTAAELPALPAGLRDRLDAPKRSRLRARPEFTEDDPIALAWADEYLEREPLPVEGDHSDAQVFKVAAALHDYGLSPTTIVEKLTDWSGFDNWWVEAKVASAFRNAQNQHGCKAPRTAANVFTVAGTEAAPLTKNRHPFNFLSAPEQDALQPPEWLIEGWFPKQGTALIYGAPGSYKTFAAIDLWLGVATGGDIFGKPVKCPGPTLYLAAEGANAIAKKRRPAWQVARGVTSADTKAAYLNDGATPLATEKDITALIKSVRGAGIAPRVVIVDTFAKFTAPAGFDENSARDTTRAIHLLDRVAQDLHCLVAVLHHSGKDEGRAVRGSSALAGGFDAVFRVDADKDATIATVSCQKQKDADEPRPMHLQGRLVAGSLVFDPIEAAEYKRLTASASKYNAADIGQVLRNAGCFGEAKGIPTKALAQELMRFWGEQPATVECEQKRLDNIVKRLSAARLHDRKVQPLATKSEHGWWVWSVPGADPANPFDLEV